MAVPEAPVEVFHRLREQLFSGDLIARSQLDAGSARAESDRAILGVAMDVGIENGSYLVFGLRDGTASLYVSNGGGSIGGQGRPEIRAAAKQLVSAARPFVARLPRVEQHPLPARGRVRFSVFTDAGVRAVEADESELMNGRGELLPLFAAAHQIIAGFRLLQEPEPHNEASYANCLLTILARGGAASVTLTEGAPPPDLARLATGQSDREWIERIGFALDRLSTKSIMRILLRLAGFRWFHFMRVEGRIHARLAADAGKSFADASFRVLRRRRDGRREIEVAFAGSATTDAGPGSRGG